MILLVVYDVAKHISKEEKKESLGMKNEPHSQIVKS